MANQIHLLGHEVKNEDVRKGLKSAFKRFKNNNNYRLDNGSGSCLTCLYSFMAQRERGKTIINCELSADVNSSGRRVGVKMVCNAYKMRGG